MVQNARAVLAEAIGILLYWTAKHGSRLFALAI
jgi:hypothetical protein